MRRIRRTIVSMLTVSLLLLSACQNNTDPLKENEEVDGSEIDADEDAKAN